MDSLGSCTFGSVGIKQAAPKGTTHSASESFLHGLAVWFDTEACELN